MQIVKFASCFYGYFVWAGRGGLFFLDVLTFLVYAKMNALLARSGIEIR